MHLSHQNKKKSTDITKVSTKEKIANVFQIPKDIMLGSSIVTVIGNDEVWVENYKGILEYTSDAIILQGKKCQISISGKRLCIVYYTSDDMKICGFITAINYL